MWRQDERIASLGGDRQDERNKLMRRFGPSKSYLRSNSDTMLKSLKTNNLNKLTIGDLLKLIRGEKVYHSKVQTDQF